MGLSDFTEVADLDVTVAGQLLDCRLYHFRLPFSGFDTPMSCSAAKVSWHSAEGLQNALWSLGGVPSNTEAIAFRPRSAISARRKED